MRIGAPLFAGSLLALAAAAAPIHAEPGGTVGAEPEMQLAQSSSRRTGKQAEHASPDNRCQIVGGKVVCGAIGRTGKNIPAGPNFGSGAPAAPTAAEPAELLLAPDSVERCTANWRQHFQWVGLRPPPVASRCAKPAPADLPPLRLRTMRDMAELVFGNYKDRQHPAREPILIAAIANWPGRYLVALSGTEFQLLQATGIVEDIFTSLNMSDPYSLFVLSALHEYDGGRGVPQGVGLVLAGHSLGGMVSQNIAGDRARFFRWKPERVLTLGSPKTVTLPPGLAIRFAAEGDPVVTLSPIAIPGLAEQIWVDSGVLGKWPGDIANHLNYPRSTRLADFTAMGQPR